MKIDNTTAIAYLNKFGGDSISRSKPTDETALDMRNINLLATHLVGILTDEESWVMKDRTDWMLCLHAFQDINRRIRQLQVDLFASRLTHQLHDYVSWRPDPYAMAICIHPRLDKVQWVCQPTLESNRQSPNTCQTSEGKTGNCSTSLEVTDMVPDPTGDGNQETTPTARCTESNSTHSQSQLTHRVNPMAIRVGYLRNRFRSREISEGASELLLASWQQKSAKSYDSLFNKWIGWLTLTPCIKDTVRGSNLHANKAGETISAIQSLVRILLPKVPP